MGPQSADLATAFVLERHRRLTAAAAGPIALFGAGWFAQGLLALLRAHNLPLPSAIIDEARFRPPVAGIPVLGIQDAVKAGWAQPGRLVLIALNQRHLAATIEAKLHASGIAATCLIPPDLCPLPGWDEATPLSVRRDCPHEMVVFHHVPKSGGTSYTSLLRAYFGDDFLDVNSPADWRVCERFVRDRPNARRICIAGHDALGVHELAPGRRVRYVTLLRHPWNRFVSSINFRVGLGAHVDRITIPRNRQLGLFSLRRSLNEAKDTLDRWFEAVGLLERYADAVTLFAERLQLPAYVEHSNKSRDWRTSALTALRPRFEAENQDDLAFYEYARARFERDLHASPAARARGDDAIPSTTLREAQPDTLADELKVARQSDHPRDLIGAHTALFSRSPYGALPAGVVLEHMRLQQAAGRADLAVFWHHGGHHPSARAAEYAQCLAALDPFTIAALTLHIELVRLGPLGQGEIAITMQRTRNRWQTELHRHLLRAHLLRRLQSEPDVHEATTIWFDLPDETWIEALHDVAAHLGIDDRVHAVGARDEISTAAAAVVLVQAVGNGVSQAAPAQTLPPHTRVITLRAPADPDWPHFAAFSRGDAVLAAADGTAVDNHADPATPAKPTEPAHRSVGSPIPAQSW